MNVQQPCTFCKRQNHFASVCRQKQSLRSNNLVSDDSYNTTAIVQELCSVKARAGTNSAIAIDHHQFYMLSKTWIKRSSDPQPFIKLDVSTSKEDYIQFGYTLHAVPQTSKFSVMADTGCQSCLAGIKVANKLNLKQSDLIPVTMKMRAANNKGINILGAAILCFKGRDQTGKYVEKRQITYITDSSDKVFLSKEACVALGMISQKFPQVGDMNRVSSSSRDRQPAPCKCPQRQKPPPPPTKVPFPPIEANRKHLERYLLDYYKASIFNTYEHQLLPMMEGPPMKLMIDPTVQPIAFHTPVPVPLHWLEEVKKGLDQDVCLGVIEPVPVGEPVTWCHRMVVCAKKNGSPRRTVDLQGLNAHATRETHHTQSPFHQARAVPKGKKKTVLDAWNGYHSVPIREEDRHLTTFITPWGRYRYRTAPQGYIASGDGYSRRYDEIVSHIQHKTKCIDDTLIWSDDIESNFFQTVEWLDVCGRKGVTLNPKKFIFSADVVEFACFEISLNKVRPCEKCLVAIRDFPTPKTITDIRSWFGLVNQVSYAFSMTSNMLPFRKLLKPNSPFTWDTAMEEAFQVSKHKIVEEIKEGVEIFDKDKPTCLATDWSKAGIGFWLSQKHCSCSKTDPYCCRTGWKTTLIGSRFTHAAESRYAPIEGEALAVADALNKAHYFVLGCANLIVAIAHKPLLKMLGDRSLEDIPNARLRNLKEKTLRYKFRMCHIPGAKHKAPDATSRNPTGDSQHAKLELPDDETMTCHSDSFESSSVERSLLFFLSCCSSIYPVYHLGAS